MTDEQAPLFEANGQSSDASKSTGENAIRQILVQKLFGQYDYELPTKGTLIDLSNLLILYGGNGSGKTTILEILFHLLSSADNRGHRTALSKIPFHSVKVILTDDTWLAASRESDLVGSYWLRGKSAEQEFEAYWDVGRAGNFTAEQAKSFHSFLKTLEQTVYLLSAGRRIMGDQLPNEPKASDAATPSTATGQNAERNSNRADPNLPLERAVQRTNEWIRSRALEATTAGTVNANTIYADIINRLANTPRTESPDGEQVRRLSETLSALSLRSNNYAKFLLTSPFKIEDMLKVLAHSDGPSALVIANVLEPYIDGTRARLDALEPVRKITSSLVENLNSFYSGKTVSFDLVDGLKVKHPDGTELQTTMLSSGEQQLLMMFCQTIVHRAGQSILMIDEPELSLNAKWQRKLIGALQELVEGTNVQFIFASHSVEFLSEHLENVVELIPMTSQSLSSQLGAPSDPTDNR